MSRALWLVLLFLIPGASAVPEYSLGFACDATACPEPVADTDDVLGAPALVLDPVRGQHVIGSLHGTPQDGGRAGQQFTLLTRLGSWTDGPGSIISGAIGKQIEVARGGSQLAVAVHISYNDAPDEVLAMEGPQEGLEWRDATPLPRIGNASIQQIGLASDGATRMYVLTWLDGDGLRMATSPWGQNAWSTVFLGVDCAAVTDPVAYQGTVYIGCQDEAGDVTLLRGPTAGPLTAAGTARVIGKPSLAVGPDERIAIAAADPAGLQVVHGAYLPELDAVVWNDTQHLALPPAAEGFSLDGAQVQDALYRDSGAVLVVIQQPIKHDVAGHGLPVVQKHILAVHARHGLLDTIEIPMQGPAERAEQPTFLLEADDVYHDRKDSLVGLNGRAYFAVGDHGRVRFAEVTEATSVVPAALPAANGTQGGGGAPGTADAPVAQEAPLPLLVPLAALALLVRRR